MGSVTETCGYVSDVGFMIVVNASSFVTALIVYLLYRKGVVAEGGIVQSPAIIALSTGMLVSREEAASVLPAEILVVILGAVCGFSIVLLCVVWIDTLVRLRTMKLALLVLVLGLTLKEVVYAWACGLSGITFQLFTVGLLLLSAILLFFSNRNRRPVELSQTLEEDKYSFVKSFIALFILVGLCWHYSYHGNRIERRGRCRPGRYGSRGRAVLHRGFGNHCRYGMEREHVESW